MTRQQAVRELRRRRVDDTHYVVDGVTRAPAPEGALYLAHGEQGWEVGVQERGRRDPHAVLDTEDAACRLLLELLERPGHQADRPWWLRWT